MLANLPAIQKHLQRERPHVALGQGGLFADPIEEDLKLTQVPEFPPQELLWRERLALGTFVSGHPLDPYRHKLTGKVTHQCRESFDMLRSGTSARIVVAGLVRSYRHTGRIAFLTLEDGTGALDMIAFNDEAERFAHCLVEDAILAIKLKPRYDNDRSGLQLLEAHRLGHFRGPK